MLSDNTAWQPWRILNLTSTIASTSLKALLGNNRHVVGLFTLVAGDQTSLDVGGQPIFFQGGTANTFGDFERPIPVAWYDQTTGLDLNVAYVAGASGELVVCYIDEP